MNTLTQRLTAGFTVAVATTLTMLTLVATPARAADAVVPAASEALLDLRSQTGAGALTQEADAGAVADPAQIRTPRSDEAGFLAWGRGCGRYC